MKARLPAAAAGPRDPTRTARGFAEARAQAESWTAPSPAQRRLAHIVSAWKGHEEFAGKLVRFLEPEVVVDLGVDYGYSAFAFALPNIGAVYGIDWFRGDVYAGHRDTYAQVRAEMVNLRLSNLELIHADFSTAARSWERKIDILHIDGDHHYDSVKRDFEQWARFVREDGIILMHDTISFPDDVGRFYEELQLPKFNFTHSHGLGIVCRNRDLLAQVVNL
jgi:predicted O-methyltransferase YrrM